MGIYCRIPSDGMAIALLGQCYNLCEQKNLPARLLHYGLDPDENAHPVKRSPILSPETLILVKK